MSSIEQNDQLALIVGYSSAGKTASLRNIRNQHKWLYLITEAGKRCSVRNRFKSFKIEEPSQVFEAFDYALQEESVDGVIVDSLTYLMDMYETQLVLPSANKMNAWSDYNQFFKILMQQKVVSLNKPVLMTAHVLDQYDEKSLEMKTYVPIKGALKNTGIESYFSTVVAAKRKTIKELEPYKNSMLTITDEEAALGFKYVFQTKLTKSSTGERIRSPLDMFSTNETFIDNDAQLLLDHLVKYYETSPF